jgi:hypothetical protein
MTLHTTTFEYLKPTERQLTAMLHMRHAALIYSEAIEENVPEGPDKTYILRRLREIAMWVNVALTRNADGSPRDDRALPEYPPGRPGPDYPPDHSAPGDLGSVPL